MAEPMAGCYITWQVVWQAHCPFVVCSAGSGYSLRGAAVCLHIKNIQAVVSVTAAAQHCLHFYRPSC